MSRMIRHATGVVGVVAASLAVASGTFPPSGATVQPSAATVIEPASTDRTVPSTWGDVGSCPPTEAGGTGWVRWEVTSAAPSSAQLDQIVRIRFSSECPGVTHAMTFDIWLDPELVLTAEIDFVGPVDVTLDQDELNTLGLGAFQQGAAMWGGAVLVNIAPETRGRETTLLGTFGPGDPSLSSDRCRVLPADEQLAVASHVETLDGQAVPQEQVQVVERAAGRHVATRFVAPAPARRVVLDDDHPALVGVGRLELDRLTHPLERAVVEKRRHEDLEHFVDAVGREPSGRNADREHRGRSARPTGARRSRGPSVGPRTRVDGSRKTSSPASSVASFATPA